MSDVYIQRLRSVRNEFDASRTAIAHILSHWNTPEIIEAFSGVPRKNFEQASQYLEVTYFVRLFAEFEGILKDHLATNHPAVSVVHDPKVDWLISRARRSEGLRIDPTLHQRINEVRAYRNAIAHSAAPAAVVTFQQALSTLNKFLDKLPDPRK